jgi:hypothetical protein
MLDKYSFARSAKDCNSQRRFSPNARAAVLLLPWQGGANFEQMAGFLTPML